MPSNETARRLFNVADDLDLVTSQNAQVPNGSLLKAALDTAEEIIRACAVVMDPQDAEEAAQATKELEAYVKTQETVSTW